MPKREVALLKQTAQNLYGDDRKWLVLATVRAIRKCRLASEGIRREVRLLCFCMTKYPSFMTKNCYRSDMDEAEKFFSKVNKTEECWLWTAGTLNSGYGSFGKILAHRWSYAYHFGEIPERMCVCHTCDVRLCVNPDHLWLGTYQDNILDMHKKGRHRGGRPKGSQNKKSIERNSEILRRWKNGERQKDLAIEYRLAPETISRICNRRVVI